MTDRPPFNVEVMIMDSQIICQKLISRPTYTRLTAIKALKLKLKYVGPLEVIYLVATL